LNPTKEQELLNALQAAEHSGDITAIEKAVAQLSLYYVATERLAIAAPYWQKGALLLAQTTSPISLELATHLHNMAVSCLLPAGMTEEARSALLRAQEIYSLYSDPDAEVLRDVAKLLQELQPPARNKTMLQHSDFRKSGKLSIWIGNFSSELELDEYINLSREFEQDFGFELNERDMPETSVQPEQLPIRKLVDGFSRSHLYAQSVVGLAEEKRIDRATTMVIFFNFEYEPERTKPNDRAPLKFLGTVPCS
jgi:hypothetical protein